MDFLSRKTLRDMFEKGITVNSVSDIRKLSGELKCGNVDGSHWEDRKDDTTLNLSIAIAKGISILLDELVDIKESQEWAIEVTRKMYEQ